eukprot:IDg11251t1
MPSCDMSMNSIQGRALLVAFWLRSDTCAIPVKASVPTADSAPPSGTAITVGISGILKRRRSQASGTLAPIYLRKVVQGTNLLTNAPPLMFVPVITLISQPNLECQIVRMCSDFDLQSDAKMAKSKRSKVKMAYKAMRRQAMEKKLDERQRKLAAKTYDAVGLPMPAERPVEARMPSRTHNGCVLVTTFVPTAPPPKRNIVHGPLARDSSKDIIPVPIIGFPIPGAGAVAR